jgi:DMSO reductase anchor subunit
MQYYISPNSALSANIYKRHTNTMIDWLLGYYQSPFFFKQYLGECDTNAELCPWFFSVNIHAKVMENRICILSMVLGLWKSPWLLKNTSRIHWNFDQSRSTSYFMAIKYFKFRDRCLLITLHISVVLWICSSWWSCEIFRSSW